MNALPDLYLASASPRRREILAGLGLRVAVLAIPRDAREGPDLDEAQHPGEDPAHYAERLAREKAAAGLRTLRRQGLPPRPVLAADTVVTLDGAILGKPRDTAEARDFLQRLSGRAHEVRTTVALGRPGAAPDLDALAVEASVSQVRFRALEAHEIDAYVATGEPFDKAGGYGIQGRAGIFVVELRGSFTGVMGLPVAETAALLASAGVRVL